MKKRILREILLITATALLAACQGRPSTKPPIHLNPNMDHQPKYRPQAESKFFENGQAMRPPVPGTVARGELREDLPYYFGKDQAGKHINYIPVDVDMKLLQRGQERFNIYCAPCHSRLGDGQGIVVKKGFLPPPSFHLDRVRAFADGYIYDVISNGVRNMPSYKHQIPVADRWAIVAYVRALQRTQSAAAKDIPEAVLKDLK